MSLSTAPLSDQLQAVVSSVAALEQSSAQQSQQNSAMVQQIATLTAQNAALKQQLAAEQPPPVADKSAIEWGFVANDTDPLPAVKLGLARIKADGGGWVRLWHSSFGDLSSENAALIAAAAANGIKVILCVQPKDTAPQTLGQPDFTTFVARNAAMLKNVYAVEAGNELNLTQYRPDDLGGEAWHKAYVDQWLRPLSTVVAKIGVKTLCTSVADTYHPENYGLQYDALLAAGARDCCDGVAIHAYFQPAALPTLATILADLKTKWAKPIHVTECNVLTKGLSVAAWQQQFPAYLNVIRTAGVASLQFYRGVPKTNGKWTWPTLFDANGAVADGYATFVGTVK